MLYRFGAFELDDEAGELRERGGRTVEIQPKPFALLALLLRERARVVPTRELFDTLWPDTAVTPGSLTRAVSHARRAIDDTHRGAWIKSFSRRGYRFCGDVVALERGAGAAPAAARAAPGGAFVGREAALERLSAAWADAVGGRGGVVLVTGPPGIGKTRLVEVFAAGAGARGARVLVGRSREGDGVPAFWLWAQILRQLAAEDVARAELRQAAARSEELAELLPDLSTARPPAARAPAEPERSRFLLFDAVTRALSRASRARPLLVVLEDLQSAGSPSLRLLEHLAFETAADPVLLVGTVRDEFRERGHPLARTLATLRQQERCVELELGAFSRREVAALLERVMGRPAPSDLTSELYARTEGVPLFLREAIRLLGERGALADPEKIPRAGVALPGRALELIQSSLDALPPREAALVGAAAVLGREFPLAAAADVAEMARDEALDAIDAATRAGVVEASPDDAAAWRFTHALFREAAYEALAPGLRVRLHLRAARRLERQHEGDVDRVIAELAHHHHRALAAGDPERAFARARRAAERATGIGAWEQAAVHQEQALAALAHVEGADPERRLDVLLDLGEDCRLSGERARRREVLAEALAIARSLGRPHDLARAAIAFCDLQDWGVPDDAARAAVEEALAAQDVSAGPLRSRLLTRQAYLEIRDAHETARRLARRAVALARSAGDPEALQDALYVLHFSLGGPDFLDERAELVKEIDRAAEGSRSPDRALISLLDVASDRLMLGDAAGARALRARAAEVVGERPSPVMRWHFGVYDTGLALLEGRLDEVAERGRDTFRLGQRVDHPYAFACHNGHRALLARDRGDAGGVLAAFEPALRARRGPGPWVAAVVARARLEAGRRADAEALWESLAAHDFADVPRNLRFQATLVELAHLCADLGDASRAGSLSALLSPIESQHGVLPLAICYGGPASFALARLAELRGRADDACALAEEALASAEALGARPMHARIALALAALVARRDPRRAGGLAAEAADEAARLGMSLRVTG
jgi:DNA-binding winged helix-turn-helix (wHTH) protein